VENVEIIVITADGLPRNNNLVSLFPEATVFKGHDGRDVDYVVSKQVDQFANSVLYGKPFTAPQAAAVMSHHLAQVQGKKEWTCLLEDDAMVTNLSHFFYALHALTEIKTVKPLLFLLYTGHRGAFGAPIRLNDLFSILPVTSLPEGGVGYLINSALRERIREQDRLVGPPDWPTWTSCVETYALVPPVVQANHSHQSIYMHGFEDSHSSVGDNSPMNSIRASAHYLLMFKPRIIALLGGYRVFVTTILMSSIRRHRYHAVSKIRFRKLRNSSKEGS
jgi:hypothetical protein